MRPGTYALFLRFDTPRKVTAGALGILEVHGEYCYIGSAMNGLDQRISRHLSKEKKIHWHIDHLTTCANVIEAYESSSKDECGLRKRAQECGMIPAFKGFGCSDCRCDTHLLISVPAAKNELIRSESLKRFKDERE